MGLFATVPGFGGSKVLSHTLFMDQGALTLDWDHLGYGLYRVHNGIAEHYGLLMVYQAGKSTLILRRPRRGDIWVVTNGGIDVFLRFSRGRLLGSARGYRMNRLSPVLGLPRNGSGYGSETDSVIDILKNEQHSSVLPAKGKFDESVMALF